MKNYLLKLLDEKIDSLNNEIMRRENRYRNAPPTNKEKLDESIRSVEEKRDKALKYKDKLSKMKF